jgi:hypothetical protein
MMTDEHYEPGHLGTFDVPRQHMMHSLKPRLRKTWGAHSAPRTRRQAMKRLFELIDHYLRDTLAP